MSSNSERKLGPHEVLEALPVGAAALKSLQDICCEHLDIEELTRADTALKYIKETLQKCEEYTFNHKNYEASASMWKARALKAENQNPGTGTVKIQGHAEIQNNILRRIAMVLSLFFVIPALLLIICGSIVGHTFKFFERMGGALYRTFINRWKQPSNEENHEN